MSFTTKKKKFKFAALDQNLEFTVSSLQFSIAPLWDFEGDSQVEVFLLLFMCGDWREKTEIYCCRIISDRMLNTKKVHWIRRGEGSSYDSQKTEGNRIMK